MSDSIHSDACEIVDLPFYDPEKRIPRGFDKSVL